ncbi:PIR protein,putative [Plasmodium sp.]|nr:PIR protein,putative [Plasmodium sp.]
MISYIFKLIIFSIILGTLTLIHNNDSDGLHRKMNYENIILGPINSRLLEEMSYEFRTNHKYEINQLKEYGHINETKYKETKYPKDYEKMNHKIPEVTGKEYIGTPYFRKYKNKEYNKEEETKSNRSSSSLKYLEMQRKLYNNFYGKSEMDFMNFLDKLKNISCECGNKEKSSNKVNDKYLYNFKIGCAAGAGACGFCPEFLGNCGIGATGATVGETTKDLATAITAFKAAIKVSGPFGGASGPYFIAVLVLILIGVLLIILYICLSRRR